MPKATDAAEKAKRDPDAPASEAAAELEAGMRKIAADARETIDRLTDSEGAERLRAHVDDFLGNLRDTGREYGGQARAGAGRIYHAGQRRAGEGYDEISAVVRRHPAQAVGIAVGLGFLLGLIISRR